MTFGGTGGVAGADGFCAGCFDGYCGCVGGRGGCGSVVCGFVEMLLDVLGVELEGTVYTASSEAI